MAAVETQATALQLSSLSKMYFRLICQFLTGARAGSASEPMSTRCRGTCTWVRGSPTHGHRGHPRGLTPFTVLPFSLLTFLSGLNFFLPYFYFFFVISPLFSLFCFPVSFPVLLFLSKVSFEGQIQIEMFFRRLCYLHCYYTGTVCVSPQECVRSRTWASCDVRKHVNAPRRCQDARAGGTVDGVPVLPHLPERVQCWWAQTHQPGLLTHRV